MRLPIQRLDPAAIVPTRAHSGDAGLDLHALEDARVTPGAVTTVPTGIAVGIPYGHVGLIKPRSGLAARHDIDTLAGVIDHGYTGEVKVLITTHSDTSRWIRAGERVAQLLVIPIAYTQPQVVDALPDSARGDGGFGSTGRN
jgi:dUTP pyrophosphatase